MNILYITNGTSGSGGLERVLAVKASYLVDKLGYNVHILTLNDGNTAHFYEFSSKITFHDIRVSGNAINYIINYIKGIKNTIKTIHPDVISVCDDGLKGLLFPLIFGKSIPVIYERHATTLLNFNDSERPPFYSKLKTVLQHKLMRYGASKFDKFIVLTNGNVQEWIGVHCTVIPNINPYNTKPVATNKNKIVLAVGSHSYNKGYDRLIAVWEIIKKHFPEWKLHIYGKQDATLNLQNIIDSKNLTEHVFLYNPVKNIEQQYNKAAILAMPSRSEGFGMVLIEAMSFGVPCISFDCPFGPGDIIKNNEDGFLIENDNIEAFASKLLELIEDEQKRMDMGRKPTEHVQRYSSEHILPLWDELFKSLVS